MTTLLRRYGFRFHFFAGEPNEPPHIHVTGKGCLAKFWLEPIKLASARGFTVAEMRNISAVIADHRQQFVEAWHARHR